MKKDDKKIETLDAEMQFIQLENFVNKFDKAMHKNIKKSFKSLIYTLLPYLLWITAMVIFPSLVTLAIGAVVISWTFVINEVVSSRKKIKKKEAFVDKEFEKYLNAEKELSVNQVLKNGIIKAKGEDFYTQNYQNNLSAKNIETEDERKYREALEKQLDRTINTSLKVIDSKKSLNKDETMIQIIKEIDAYCIAYNIPPLTISNAAWDVFFDTLYCIFTEKGIVDKFYISMSKICRLTFAKSLINKSDAIKINDFILNLYYLQGDYNTFDVDFKKREILAIQKELFSKLQISKTIIFTNYNNENVGRKK